MVRNAVFAVVTLGAIVGGTVALITLALSSGGPDGGGSAAGDVFVLRADDTREAITNGARLDLGNTTAEVLFSDFPPRLNSSMDINVTDETSGEPVQDARVDVFPSMPMPAMSRGFMKIEAVPGQAGQYSVSWQLPMQAAWTLEIQVTSGGQTEVIELLAFMR